MKKNTAAYDNRTVLAAMAIGISLFAAVATTSPLGAGAYLIYQGSTASGAAAAGGGLSGIGGALTAYGTASSLSTAAAVGIGLTGVGGAVALG